MLERFHLAIAIVTVLASSVFLLALMLMLVEERRATVGILRLIGFRRSRILQHVLAEGVVIALAGALFGILLSVVMQGGINQFFQWRYDTALVFVRITPGVALRSIAVAVPLGVAAIFASSWSLLRERSAGADAPMRRPRFRRAQPDPPARDGPRSASSGSPPSARCCSTCCSCRAGSWSRSATCSTASGSTCV